MRPIVLTAALIALMPAASDAADPQTVIAKPPPRVTIIHPFGPVEPATKTSALWNWISLRGKTTALLAEIVDGE